MQDVVITSAVRTPIGAYCGALREIPVDKVTTFLNTSHPFLVFL